VYFITRLQFDNVIVKGEIDPITDNEGLMDNFNDGIFKEIWNVRQSEGAAIYELNGLLNIDISGGVNQDGSCHVGCLITKDFVIHGDFDVQVDFFVCPEYHNTPNCNAKLFLTDRNGMSVEISIRTGRYESRELPGEGEEGTTIKTTHTIHQAGKLRITKTSPACEH
jgi:hypothetical protein